MVDTVGAGDSFLATLIVRLLKGKSPQKSLNYACSVGALVAGQEGANPKISDIEIRKYMMLKDNKIEKKVFEWKMESQIPLSNNQ